MEANEKPMIRSESIANSVPADMAMLGIIMFILLKPSPRTLPMKNSGKCMSPPSVESIMYRPSQRLSGTLSMLVQVFALHARSALHPEVGLSG